MDNTFILRCDINSVQQQSKIIACPMWNVILSAEGTAILYWLHYEPRKERKFFTLQCAWWTLKILLNFKLIPYTAKYRGFAQYLQNAVKGPIDLWALWLRVVKCWSFVYRNHEISKNPLFMTNKGVWHTLTQAEELGVQNHKKKKAGEDCEGLSLVCGRISSI